MNIAENGNVEKFTPAELLNLRNELLQAGIDSWQAAEVLSGFLTGRGYGVNAQHARDALHRIDSARCDLECIQQELEKLAFVM